MGRLPCRVALGVFGHRSDRIFNVFLLQAFLSQSRSQLCLGVGKDGRCLDRRIGSSHICLCERH